MIHETQSVQISQQQDERNIHVIVKTMCPPVTTPMAHVPRCMSYHKAIVVITGKAHCLHDNIYVYTDIYIYIYIYIIYIYILYIYIYIYIDIYMYVCLHLYYYYCNLLN